MCRGRPLRSWPRLPRQTQTPLLPPKASNPSARPRSLRWQRCSPTWNLRWAPRIRCRFSCAPSWKRRRKSAMVRSHCWRRSTEKRLRTRQKTVEASTTKRDQLQLFLQADKLHEALTQRREQEAELMDLLSQVAADLLLAAPRRCTPRRSAKRSRKRWLYAREAIFSNSRSPCALRWGSSGGWPLLPSEQLDGNVAT